MMWKVKYERFNPSNGEYTPHESKVYFSKREAQQYAAKLTATGADSVHVVKYIPYGSNAN